MDRNRIQALVMHIKRLFAVGNQHAVKAFKASKVAFLNWKQHIFAKTQAVLGTIVSSCPVLKKRVKECIYTCKQIADNVIENAILKIKKRYSALTEEKKQFLSSVSISACIVSVVGVILLSTCSVGYTVSINGQTLGTVQSKKEYEAALSSIREELSYICHGDFETKSEPSFSCRLIAKGDYTPQEKLVESIKATSDDMLPAYGVYSDGVIMFSLPNEAAAISVLDAYKNSFSAGKENAWATFCTDVEVAYRFVPRASLKTQAGAQEALENGRIFTHMVKEGETLLDVATRYDVSLEELMASNGIVDADSFDKETLYIKTGEPVLSVKTVYSSSGCEPIPFDTVEQTDASQYIGKSYVAQKGVEGEREIKAYVTEINGVETKREILSENIICAAVNEIVVKGTKALPKAYGTGDFIVPAGGGSLSSRFGARWGRKHEGIDIAAPVGTDIYAADNGKVMYAEYHNGGYGYMVQIDHGNGFKTYYAHCSELLVESGSVVAKGDLIARVGNTGRSTGAHLHFEVLKDEAPVDPLLYIDSMK